MNLSASIAAIWLGAAFCFAQAINISGVVQDRSGVGIVGATVKLENANLSAASGAGGVFTLKEGSTSAKPHSALDAMTVNPVQFQNGKIAFTLADNTSVGIYIKDIGGKQVFDIKRTLDLGTHLIKVPLQTAGIYLCKVTIGHESYSFKTMSFGAFSTQQAVVASGTVPLARNANTSAVIADVISVVKEGQLDYRDSIKTSDATGIVIQMIPNAGNVTDADGNVYQSVRIGNQVWTVVNLMTTKYNDGTPIPYTPEGWRVPTVQDWHTLDRYLIENGYNWDGTTSGGKAAKSMAAKTDWSHDNTDSKAFGSAGLIGHDMSKNNASGFSALPGQLRYSNGG